MITGDKVVYLHRKATDNTVFYVGIGNSYRPYQRHISQRSVVWHRTVNKHGYTIEVIRRGLSKEEACSIEIDLIELIGRRDLGKGTLVNLTDGGEGFAGVSQLNKEKRVICLNTGVVYKSITDCSKATGIGHSSISGFLNKPKKTKRRNNKELNFRFLDGNNIVWIPYFDGDMSIKNLKLTNFDVVYTPFDFHKHDVEQKNTLDNKKQLYLLENYEIKFLELRFLSGLSLRNIAKITNISTSKIFYLSKKIINKLKKTNNYSRNNVGYKIDIEIINKINKLNIESKIKINYNLLFKEVKERKLIEITEKKAKLQKAKLQKAKEIQERKKENTRICQGIIEDKIYKLTEVSKILRDTKESIKQKCEKESSVHRNFNGKYTIKGSVIKKWIKERHRK